MNPLSKRATLAIAAVVDVGLHAKSAPVSSLALTERHSLPPRYLEAIFQALVRAKILQSGRGPHGGYILARQPSEIAVGEIVRVVQAMSAADSNHIGAASKLLKSVIEPRVSKAGEGFLAALDCLTIADLCSRMVGAERANKSA